MAKNLSRKFATMSEDDRPVELDFEEPREGE